MRRAHGDAGPLRSLFVVFGLQGVLMWIVSLPVQAAVRASGVHAPPQLLRRLPGVVGPLRARGEASAFGFTGDFRYPRPLAALL
jgi:hypothetical protein